MGESGPPVWFRAARAVIRRLPAGRFRAFAALPAPPPFVDRVSGEAGGWQYRCDLRHLIAREISLTGRYAPAETAAVRELLPAGGTFVDVGANVGYFACLAARRVGPGGRVVALEPDPRMVAELRANLALNRFSAHVVEAAAAEGPGIARLAEYRPEDGNWGTSALRAEGLRPVELIGLDALLDRLGIQHVDLVKVDVEGAEDRVLKGMQDGFSRGRYGAVLVEVHPWEHPEFPSMLREMQRTLTAAGYAGWVLEPPTRAEYYGARPGFRLQPLLPDTLDDRWPHLLWRRR